MVICKKCGAEFEATKKGVSKKNGKPWKGGNCPMCEEFGFENLPKIANDSNIKTATLTTTLAIDKLKVLELATTIAINSKDNQNLWDDIVAQAGQIENLLLGKIITKDEEI